MVLILLPFSPFAMIVPPLLAPRYRSASHEAWREDLVAPTPTPNFQSLDRYQIARSDAEPSSSISSTAMYGTNVLVIHNMYGSMYVLLALYYYILGTNSQRVSHCFIVITTTTSVIIFMIITNISRSLNLGIS